MFFAAMAALQSSPGTLIGLSVTAVVLIYELWLLYRNLPLNHRQGKTELLPTLGAGTWLTMLRGLFLALLAGFFVLPKLDGWLAWLPGGLYLLAAVADYLDGIAARATNHSTVLGHRLDLDFDALGILIAPCVAVRYGLLPVWYLAVSAARYLFMIGTWALERQGKTVYTLPHSYARRFLAGFQMGLCAVALLPVLPSPLKYTVATLFMIPFLAGFTRDWLITSGALKSDSPRYVAWQAGADKLLTRFLPLLLRPGLVVLWLMARVSGSGSAPSPANALIEAAAVIAVAAGVIGRLAALILLISFGLGVQVGSPDALAMTLAVTATLLMLTGSGAYALWSPDEVFLRAHVGYIKVKDR